MIGSHRFKVIKVLQDQTGNITENIIALQQIEVEIDVTDKSPFLSDYIMLGRKTKHSLIKK